MGKPKLEFKEYHTATSGIFFSIDRVLRHTKSDYQDILLFENEFWGKVFVLDGLVMSTDRDEFFYHEALTHPPMVISGDINEVLIVGGGDGGTLREVLKYGVKKVIIAEIDVEVLRLAKDFLNMEGTFADERVFIRVEDGFKVVKEGNKYDVILVDSTDPVGPAEVLFSREFIEGLRESLNEWGFLSMQLGNPLFYKDQITQTYNIVRQNFKNVKLYASFTPTYPGGFWVFLLAGDGEVSLKRSLPKDNRFLVSGDVLQALLKFEDFIKRFCEIA
ncbi:MAG: polyamine aminopropyltransferase [candidate division WOR-3 bacterium]